MNGKTLADSPCGHLTPSQDGALAYVPDPLRVETIAADVPANLLASASLAVGELRGIGKNLGNPYLLINPLQRKEAVASSRIEGTHTTLSDLFQLEAGGNPTDRDDTREVANYVAALQTSISAIETLPISTRMILEIHRTLMAGLRQHRGGLVEPGMYKRDQNYIGGTSLGSARFVPCPPNETHRLMSELENFIHSDQGLSTNPLILAAMVHYQFETIHPFPDGNGRVGRLLIPLILIEREVLVDPLLYISPYIEGHKDEYIARLFEVSRSGEWRGWIEFFLRAVESTCNYTIQTISKLQEIRSDYISRVQTPRASSLLPALVDKVCEFPVISVPETQRALGVTYRASKNLVDRLVAVNILTDLPNTNRPKLYYSPGVIEALD